jgi:hypothetical protein
MQQEAKKIELLWSLAISMALLQGIRALTKSPRQATGTLDPHNESSLETHELDSQKTAWTLFPDSTRAGLSARKHLANSWSANALGPIRAQQ